MTDPEKAQIRERDLKIPRAVKIRGAVAIHPATEAPQTTTRGTNFVW